MISRETIDFLPLFLYLACSIFIFNHSNYTEKIMNKKKINTIIQYALLVAGQEDDYIDRDLGPIHLIKYVYLADLSHARYNNGETYTGIRWRFHNFGPWSNDVNNCIEPALEEISAKCKILPSNYDSDYKRWSLTDDALLEKLGVNLPLVVVSVVDSSVHKFKKDTSSLLEHVYRTEPMLKAAPGEFLDFTSAVPSKRENEEFTSKWSGLTTKKQKKFKQAMGVIREKRKARNGLSEKRLVPSPIPVIDEGLYFEGLDWVDSLAGEAVVKDTYEANFSNSVWHSKTREGHFPE